MSLNEDVVDSIPRTEHSALCQVNQNYLRLFHLTKIKTSQNIGRTCTHMFFFFRGVLKFDAGRDAAPPRGGGGGGGGGLTRTPNFWSLNSCVNFSIYGAKGILVHDRSYFTRKQASKQQQKNEPP